MYKREFCVEVIRFVCVLLSCTQADKRRSRQHLPAMLHEATRMMLDLVLHLTPFHGSSEILVP